MNRPTYPKEVRQFIGVANLCRKMLTRSSHTLALLPNILPNKRKFKLTKIRKYDFDKI